MRFNGLLLLFVLTVAPAPLSAQEPLAKGAVVPRVECSAKPEQSYALYIWATRRIAGGVDCRKPGLCENP